MAGEKPTIIKKYANRRLYHTGTSTYVTLEDLARMVKSGEDFVVTDAKTGEDITRAVLGQIIFEQEGRGGQPLLPIAFLRQLIRFYGDQMQTLLPTYLESSLSAFTHNQDKLREQMTRALLRRRARRDGGADAAATWRCSPRRCACGCRSPARPAARPACQATPGSRRSRRRAKRRSTPSAVSSPRCRRRSTSIAGRK